MGAPIPGGFGGGGGGAIASGSIIYAHQGLDDDNRTNGAVATGATNIPMSVLTPDDLDAYIIGSGVRIGNNRYTIAGIDKPNRYLVIESPLLESVVNALVRTAAIFGSIVPLPLPGVFKQLTFRWVSAVSDGVGNIGSYGFGSGLWAPGIGWNESEGRYGGWTANLGMGADDEDFLVGAIFDRSFTYDAWSIVYSPSEEVVKIIPIGTNAGILQSVTVSDGGAGYPNVVPLTVSGGGGEGAIVEGSAVAGVITSVVVTDGGTGYYEPPGVLITQPSTGAGAQFTPNIGGYRRWPQILDLLITGG